MVFFVFSTFRAFVVADLFMLALGGPSSNSVWTGGGGIPVFFSGHWRWERVKGLKVVSCRCFFEFASILSFGMGGPGEYHIWRFWARSVLSGLIS
jgi:hypothetical protein